MVIIDYHDDLKEVQGDARLAAMLSAPAAPSPFDRLEWWQALEAECGLKPLVAVARRGDAQAALALQPAVDGMEALANWYNFTFQPNTSTDGEPLLAELAKSLASRTHRIALSRLPDETGVASRVEAAFRKAGWLTFRTACDSNHVLQVAGRSFADYLAARPGPLRTTLKRKGGKVSVSIETDFNPASWDAYEAIYRQSWKPEEGSPAFLRRFAEAEGRAGRLRLGIARLDGEPVAAQFWTVENGIAYIHKLAHTEASKPVSPGTTLSAALFERVIDHDKVSLVDFGTGDDPYKRDWMEQVRPRFRLECYRPANPRNWSAIAKQTLRSLARRGSRG